MDPTVARRADWQNEPLPAAHATIALARDFPAADMAAIARGVLPREMEDKWFIYFESDRLHCHRSWTGHCIYVVEFARPPAGDGGARAVRLLANRDPAQYRETDDARDREMLWVLVDIVLLHRPRRLSSPVPPAPPARS